ncbi:MAG: hypothetical protein JNM06_09200 [Blastocatellia bacterium]|nr:hypothetical protein [Blastocatellia bacterium]
MWCSFVQLNTYFALANAKVIIFFSDRLSTARYSNQAKKSLRTTSNCSNALEYILSIILIKLIYIIQSNPNKEIPNQKLRNISSLLDMKIFPLLELQVSGSF